MTTTAFAKSIVHLPGYRCHVPSHPSRRGSGVVVRLDVRSSCCAKVIDAWLDQNPDEAALDAKELERLRTQVVGTPALVVVDDYGLDVLHGTGIAMEISQFAARGLWGRISADPSIQPTGIGNTTICGQRFTGPWVNATGLLDLPGIFIVSDETEEMRTPLKVDSTSSVLNEIFLGDALTDVHDRIFGELAIYVRYVSDGPNLLKREAEQLRRELIGGVDLSLDRLR